MIQPLDGGEICLFGKTAALSASTSLPSGEPRWSDRADAGQGLPLIGGVAAPATQRAPELWAQPFRPDAAEVDDGFALYIFARVIVVVDGRQIKTVTEELDLLDGKAAFTAYIFRKRDALAIFECPGRAIRLHREGRMVGALDAQHPHALKIRPV